MTLQASRIASKSTSPDLAPVKQPQQKRSLLRTHGLVLLGYGLLTVALTYPVAFQLTTQLPGGGDAWQNVWNLWWVKQALLVLHTNPWHTDLLYYPEGVNLYFHTLVFSAGLVGIPLQLLGFNLIATYNTLLLLTFVLAGYSMYLLCMYLTGHRWASFLGGLVFAFSPYHFAHMFGHLNLVSVQWMPFYVLALLKAFEPAPVIPLRSAATNSQNVQPNATAAPSSPWLNSSLKWSVAAGALLALNAYTDWLYAIFLVLFTGIFVAWRLLAPSERSSLGGGLRSWLEASRRLATLGLAFIAVSAPIFFPTLKEATAGYAQQPPLETLVYSADLTSAVTPSELHPIWGTGVKEQLNKTGPYLPIKNPSERVVFLGYATLFLAAVGLWRLRRLRQVRFWAFAAIATWVLSLGPILQYMGQTKFTLFDTTIPLPYLLLYQLPLFNIMRTPARLTVLTMLALAVLVAFAVASLIGQRTLSRPKLFLGRSVVWGVVLPATILFESLSTPFPMVPPGWGVPIYSKIAAEPGNFALVELPIRPFSDYMAYQTVHGKPLVGGYISRQPPYPTLQQIPVLHYLLDTTSLDDVAKAQVLSGQGVSQLQKLGVKYVIIRWWAFTPELKAAIRAKLDLVFARSPDYSYPSDQVDVWELK